MYSSLPVQDVFWQYVHSKIKERDETVDEDDWERVANAWEFLRDDAVSTFYAWLRFLFSIDRKM